MEASSQTSPMSSALGIERPEALAQRHEEVVGQLIHHVQPQAVGTQPEPFGDDALVAAEEIGR